jgi:hypothetical protein
VRRLKEWSFVFDPAMRSIGFIAATDGKPVPAGLAYFEPNEVRFGAVLRARWIPVGRHLGSTPVTRRAPSQFV